MMRWLLAVLFILYAISASAATQWVESLGVGGGYGDATDGGALLDSDGTVYTNGDVYTDGTVTSTDNISTAGALFESGDYSGASSEGLVGYWRCEVASTPLPDWSGGNSSGTFGGSGTTTGGGKYGDGLAFNGSGYISAGTAVSTTIATSSNTVCAWFKSTYTGDKQILVGAYGSALVGLLALTTGAVQAQYKDAAGSAIQVTSSGVNVLDGEWHLCVAVRDVSAQTGTVYVDGVAVGSGVVGAAVNTGNATVTLAAKDTGGTLSVVGSLDEVMVWNRALSAGEVRALYMQRRELQDSHGATYNGGTVTVAGDVVTSDGAVLPSIVTFTANDTTPTVTAGNVFIVPATWTAGNNITAFDDGVNGQTITVIGGDADCAVADGATVELAGGANWTATPEDTLTLVRSGSVWYETSRSDNSE